MSPRRENLHGPPPPMKYAGDYRNGGSGGPGGGRDMRFMGGGGGGSGRGYADYAMVNRREQLQQQQQPQDYRRGARGVGGGWGGGGGGGRQLGRSSGRRGGGRAGGGDSGGADHSGGPDDEGHYKVGRVKKKPAGRCLFGTVGLGDLHPATFRVFRYPTRCCLISSLRALYLFFPRSLTQTNQPAAVFFVLVMVRDPAFYLFMVFLALCWLLIFIFHRRARKAT